MDTLARTPSKEKSQPESVQQSRSHISSHALSSSSAVASRKARSSEPDTTIGQVERASIYLPPASLVSRSMNLTRQYSSVSSRKPSIFSLSPGQLPQSKFNDGPAKDASTASGDEEATTGDDTTPTLEGDKGNWVHQRSLPAPLMLPEAALRQAKPRDSETESHRLSFSSLYSLGSAVVDRARGIAVSGPSSVAGSEPDSECHVV